MQLQITQKSEPHPMSNLAHQIRTFFPDGIITKGRFDYFNLPDDGQPHADFWHEVEGILTHHDKILIEQEW